MYYRIVTKRSIRTMPIFLGSELKEKFVNLINTGEKFYTTKSVTIHDFFDEVCEKFDKLDKEEVEYLLRFGFRRLVTCANHGCNFLLNTGKYLNCYVFIGLINLNKEKQLKNFSVKRDLKLRRIKT
jgi:nitrite reductase/ring-hydroxylating ferredoxin subunit